MLPKIRDQDLPLLSVPQTGHAATGDLIQRPPACGTDATGPNRRP
jgi:hypothetical protein